MLAYQSTNDKISCPFCSSYFGDNSSELKRIQCPNENCKKIFTFIICVCCQQKIFYLFYSKNKYHNEGQSPFDFFNGNTIKCPYFHCKQFFFLTRCPKCKKQEKIPNITEMSGVSCSGCGHNYVYLKCPIKDCKEPCLFDRPQISNNYPEGLMKAHYDGVNQVVYQKIICVKCKRAIVFYSDNPYYEGQTVTCPYKDCKEEFNRVICPMCYHENLFGGKYSMGSEIKCQNSVCGKTFYKILCYYCRKINPIVSLTYIEGYVLNCGYKHCRKESQMINCLRCNRPNFFLNLSYFSGQTIECGYKDCKTKFNTVLCNLCKNFSYFPKGDFGFGKIYTCSYFHCRKQFTLYHCPNCRISSIIDNYTEGTKIKCTKCEKIILNWNCPFCKVNIIDNESTSRKGQRMKCPNHACGKVYSFIACSKCKRLVFSKENETLDGNPLVCQNPQCGLKFVYVRCAYCQIKHTIIDGTEPIDLEKPIDCEGCKKKFYPKDSVVKPIYDKLSVLPGITGSPIKEGIPYIDENDLEIQDLFIYTKQYLFPSLIANNYNMSEVQPTYVENLSYLNAELKKCSICQNHLGESVFCPCGHRCACYPCAMKYFEGHHSCPKCNQIATSICRRVHD